MKPAIDVKKLYATAFDRLDHVGRYLDELAQLRASKAGGNGSGCADPAEDACEEADAERPSDDPEEDDIEDTRRLGEPEDPAAGAGE